MNPNWRLLGPVDIAPLARWLGEHAEGRWLVQPSPTKPQRIHRDKLPAELLQQIFEDVLDALTYYPERVAADSPMLSKLEPGQSHPMHVDRQRPDWITRVHVPITTNPGAWLAFEDDGASVHFEAGHAYTFNTMARHAFGNDGDTPRVHLIFDVLRKDP